MINLYSDRSTLRIMPEAANSKFPNRRRWTEGVIMTCVVVVVIGLFSIPTVLYFSKRSADTQNWGTIASALRSVLESCTLGGGLDEEIGNNGSDTKSVSGHVDTIQHDVLSGTKLEDNSIDYICNYICRILLLIVILLFPGHNQQQQY